VAIMTGVEIIFFAAAIRQVGKDKLSDQLLQGGSAIFPSQFVIFSKLPEAAFSPPP
jgi:hypothetical protein